MSMKCPECKGVAHTRSSRYITPEINERYQQCQNMECSTTFVTHETYARTVVKPQKVEGKP